jgi:hypothetical protein
MPKEPKEPIVLTADDATAAHGLQLRSRERCSDTAS